jgi:hypothetical protein
MGMAMVFTLVMALKDSAESMVSERAAEARGVTEREKAKAEEAENAKFNGTVVTRERFLAWRDQFRKEMEEQEKRKEELAAEEMKKKRVVKDEVKLTGRQLWEGGLAGKVDEDDEGEDALANVENLKIES